MRRERAGREVHQNLGPGARPGKIYNDLWHMRSLSIRTVSSLPGAYKDFLAPEPNQDTQARLAGEVVRWSTYPRG